MCAMRLRGFLIVLGLVCVTGAAHPDAARATATTAASDRKVLPFIADDYTQAVAEARARKVPIFIESWAPW
jgi:hypothetical protein